jgi:hypothetical protein
LRCPIVLLTQALGGGNGTLAAAGRLQRAQSRRQWEAISG